MFTYNSSLKYLVSNHVLGEIFSQWLLLFQEFYFKIIVKLGQLNMGSNYLSRIESGEEPNNTEDDFLDAHLFKFGMVGDHYEKKIHFFMMRKSLEYFTMSQKKQLVIRDAKFELIRGHLYNMGPNEIFH